MVNREWRTHLEGEGFVEIWTPVREVARSQLINVDREGGGQNDQRCCTNAPYFVVPSSNPLSLLLSSSSLSSSILSASAAASVSLFMNTSAEAEELRVNFSHHMLQLYEYRAEIKSL